MELKENNNKKNSFLWTVVLVVILAVLVLVYFKNAGLKWSANKGEEGISEEKISSLTSGKEIDTEFLNKQETEPAGTLKDDKSGKVIVREYEVKFENGKFTPQELIVASGGRIQITFKAVDADFDVEFPAPIDAYLKVKKGGQMSMGLDAPEERKGQYVFSCKDVCPEGREVKGVLVIK